MSTLSKNSESQILLRNTNDDSLASNPRHTTSSGTARRASACSTRNVLLLNPYARIGFATSAVTARAPNRMPTFASMPATNRVSSTKLFSGSLEN
jgi:hypothetical protein